MTISTFPADRNSSLSPMGYDSRFQIEARTDNFDLTSGWRLIRRRIVLIGALTALLMVPFATIISGFTPSFHAESRLIIHRPLATTLTAEDSGRNPLDLTAEMERLLSRTAAERVIQDLRLAERPEFNPALRETSFFEKIRETLRGLVISEEPSSQARNSVDAIIPEYYKALRVWRDGQGDVIQIGFASSDPQLAAAAPNRLIGVYLEERKDSIRERLDAAEEWLRQRIAEQQDRVKQARSAAEKYQESMSLVANEDAQSEQIKSIMVLSDRQAKIEQSRDEIMATISALETSADASMVSQNASVPESLGAMGRDFRTQQQDLDRLLETYGASSEAVVDLRAKILKTQTDLSLAVDRYVRAMRARLAALDRENGTIRTAFAAAEEQRSRSALAQTDLERLQRIVDREQTALDAFEGQRRSLAAQAVLPGAEVEILSPAAVPLGPQGRGRLFYLIGALLASVSIGVTTAFIVEMLDRSVRSFDQLAGIARLVPAGLIPRLPEDDPDNPSFHSGHVQRGMFDEAIRTVIISLKQSNGGKLPGSIVVTSAHSGEGKSHVARSLAIELASAGSPVLLVDGDLRHGNLDAFFGSGLKHGLNDVLAKQVEIWDVIYTHHPSGIDFIPAGNPGLRGHADLTAVAQILELARNRDQIVIFDSAPVLASTDTMHLTALAERTLVVVRWAKTGRRAVELTIQYLKKIRNVDISIAINSVEPTKHALYNFSDSELFVKSLMKYHNFNPEI